MRHLLCLACSAACTLLVVVDARTAALAPLLLRDEPAHGNGSPDDQDRLGGRTKPLRKFSSRDFEGDGTVYLTSAGDTWSGSPGKERVPIEATFMGRRMVP
ncbi:hypothetical protein CYMTET_19683 [Cymbomonas tetramitiformis]|uniref:Uncharacterized protein n=1 Tax=Cymbomonas tetramitiformis TaxID=36881 RepID=A0AAE0G5J3_9CHLO|nr:hypothetical protein CYMTET_19683 [Cymbomonas tetramitiformis]